jgi:NADPH-dependent glutamate synthase beta subunit-like oxidoreductase
MKDLGVKVVTGKELGKDFTVDSLRDKGEAKAVLGESLLHLQVFRILPWS